MPGQANSRDVVRGEDGRWEVTKPGGQRPSAITDTQFEGNPAGVDQRWVRLFWGDAVWSVLMCSLLPCPVCLCR